MAEHDDAVAAAREHLAAKDKPLHDLPHTYAAGRPALHRIAEGVLKRKRVLETGNEIALQFTSDGFGTPAWNSDSLSGKSGSVRVERCEVVLTEGEDERRAPISDIGAVLELTGVDPDEVGDGAPRSIDPEAVRAIADWFAFGTVALAELLSGDEVVDPEPIRLWPEHFDVATVAGNERSGTRANYGASSGDHDHPEPYLYIGPFEPHQGEIWNADGFAGAELGYGELLAAEDQLEAAVSFFASHRDALAAEVR